MLVFGQDEAIRAWVSERIGVSDFGPSSAIGVERHGELVAGVVYSRFSWPGIDMSMASTTPRWATRQVIGALLRYPFVQLGCRRVTANVAATNQPVRAFLSRLGFELEGWHPDAYPSGAGMSFGLLRQGAARWVEELR